MAASITVHLQIFKRLQLLSFSTDLDETGIKIHDLLRSFIEIIVSVSVAIPFNIVYIVIDDETFQQTFVNKTIKDSLKISIQAYQDTG